MRHSVGMIGATAMLMLAEAASACAPLGSARLGGDAMLIRPVGTFDPVPFKLLGPTESVVERPTEIQQTAAETEAGKPEGEEPADQCDDVVISNT